MPDRFFNNCPVQLIGHGRGWIVVVKPSGMSVHNDPGADLCSQLTQFVLSDPDLAEAMVWDPHYGLHPVHRLDKETSGVILLSCRRSVFDHASRQFADGQVTKHYLAVVHGKIPLKDPWRIWRWPLTRKSAGRRAPQGRGRRIACKTQYKCMGQSHRYSLIACRLETGRTHQIRRHAALAGHPLLGDRRYGSLRACRYLEKHHNFKRLALHSAGLSIHLPQVEGRQQFRSDELPLELERIMRQDAPSSEALSTK